MSKPKIVVFSGPRSTIANTPALVTSNKGRKSDENQLPGRFDHLIAQTIHEPVRVKIRRFSAHPLEKDARSVYHDDGNDYWEVELRPEDGSYLLPYVARRADGSPEGQPFEEADVRNPELWYGGRQSFFPDASRLFADIDRTLFGRAGDGTGSLLDNLANYEFVRSLPPGGYTTKGEVAGKDFFPYSPRPMGKFPLIQSLVRATNSVSSALNEAEYSGAIWLEGSPHLEETLYWLSLLVDTDIPIVGTSAQRMHGELSADGDRNVVDAVRYIVSGAGRNIGAVGIVDEQIFAARNFKKSDARPGGYIATGGHGGILGSTKPPVFIWFIPRYQHTRTSDLASPRLANSVSFREYGDSKTRVSIQIKDASGSLVENSIAPVHMVKYGHYSAEEDSGNPDDEVDIMARIQRGLDQENEGSYPFHGFVMESTAGSATALPSQMAALGIAAYNGFPVVRVGRGDHAGPIVATDHDLTIEGNNLDATKARVLLRAAMLKLGRLPKARDPRYPTNVERSAILEAIASYQQIFDTH